MTPLRRYKIRVHKDVTTQDSRHFDQSTKEKIKRKIREILTVSPEEVGAPLAARCTDTEKSSSSTTIGLFIEFFAKKWSCLCSPAGSAATPKSTPKRCAA